MIRPLVYITSAWSADEQEAREKAESYCRTVYEAGYSPVCPRLFYPRFLDDNIPQEHKDRVDMSAQLLRRSRILAVCGTVVNEEVKQDIALAKHLRIVATTLEGITTIEKQNKRNG